MLWHMNILNNILLISSRFENIENFFFQILEFYKVINDWKEICFELGQIKYMNKVLVTNTETIFS